MTFTTLNQVLTGDIADTVEAGLKRRCAEIDAEQAVYGLDSFDEVQLHPVIEAALREGGFGVHREQRYPGHRGKRWLSAGDRCDFVLTPAPGLPLVQEESRGTLFDDPNAVPLDEAFWLEVKVVSQFTPEGANGGYSSQLLSTVRQDVTKLSQDAGVLRAGLLIVLFVREKLVGDHDLGIWQDNCVERGLPIGAPACRCLPITDRHGNAVCVIAVYPVSHL